MQDTNANTNPRSFKWLRLRDLIELDKQSRSTIYSEVSDGTRTKPVRISANCSAWPDFERDETNAAKLAGASKAELRKIVDRLHADRTGSNIEAVPARRRRARPGRAA